MASPPSSRSESGEDSCYRPQSRTHPSESFSYKEEQYHRQRSKIPTHRSLGNDAMSRALRQISKSQFTRKIDKAKLPSRFTQPTFTIYNRRTGLVEHVSHFNQRMTVHSRNEALVCKVYPFSLGLVTMRWLDRLDEGSIGSFQEHTKAFRARFITSSPVSKRTWHSSEVFNSKRFIKTLLLQWSGLFSLTPWDPPLSLGLLQTKIRRIYLETSRIRLMNWLRSSTQMLDSLEERSSSLLQTTLQRSFTSLNPKMWIPPHMMTKFPKCQIFLKFLELNIRSHPKAHPLEQ